MAALGRWARVGQVTSPAARPGAWREVRVLSPSPRSGVPSPHPAEPPPSTGGMQGAASGDGQERPCRPRRQSWGPKKGEQEGDVDGGLGSPYFSCCLTAARLETPVPPSHPPPSPERTGCRHGGCWVTVLLGLAGACMSASCLSCWHPAISKEMKASLLTLPWAILTALPHGSLRTRGSRNVPAALDPLRA